MTPPRRLRWGVPEPPPGKHPYRDTVIVYGCLAGFVVLVAWLTGGSVGKAAAVAVVFFLVATAWNAYRLTSRAREARRRASGTGGNRP